MLLGLHDMMTDNPNSQTWISGNDVTVSPQNLVCTESEGVRKCTAGPQTIEPQNVRRICNAPRC
jgi:hypothetical protein